MHHPEPKSTITDRAHDGILATTTEILKTQTQHSVSNLIRYFEAAPLSSSHKFATDSRKAYMEAAMLASPLAVMTLCAMSARDDMKSITHRQESSEGPPTRGNAVLVAAMAHCFMEYEEGARRMREAERLVRELQKELTEFQSNQREIAALKFVPSQQIVEEDDFEDICFEGQDEEEDEEEGRAENDEDVDDVKSESLVDLSEWPLPPRRSEWIGVQEQKNLKRKRSVS